jgi:hypothetical protein
MPALGLPATKQLVMVVADRGLCFVCRGTEGPTAV